MKTNNVKIVLAPTMELAATVNPQISVEAEYGDYVALGSAYTAAHHGSRSKNLCPCIDKAIPLAGDGDTILVSHLDLDTLGGVGRALGHVTLHKQFDEFWEGASFVDTAGPHRIVELAYLYDDPTTAGKVDAAIHAYWAWSQANRGPMRARDVIHDVTEDVVRHLNVIFDILGESFGFPGALVRAGREFKAAGEILNKESLRSTVRQDGVTPVALTRKAAVFVNHLYAAPDGEPFPAVVSFNSETKAVTLSFVEASDERNACTIMQTVFGPDAGGHKGIAGSPRGVALDEADLDKVLALL